MPRLEQISERTITRLLQDAIFMKEVTATQCGRAVEVARANGWTYERIMEATGYGYTAVRGLDPRLKDEVEV